MGVLEVEGETRGVSDPRAVAGLASEDPVPSTSLVDTASSGDTVEARHGALRDHEGADETIPMLGPRGARHRGEQRRGEVACVEARGGPGDRRRLAAGGLECCAKPSPRRRVTAERHDGGRERRRHVARGSPVPPRSPPTGEGTHVTPNLPSATQPASSTLLLRGSLARSMRLRRTPRTRSRPTEPDQARLSPPSRTAAAETRPRRRGRHVPSCGVHGADRPRALGAAPGVRPPVATGNGVRR